MRLPVLQWLPHCTPAASMALCACMHYIALVTSPLWRSLYSACGVANDAITSERSIFISTVTLRRLAPRVNNSAWSLCTCMFTRCIVLCCAVHLLPEVRWCGVLVDHACIIMEGTCSIGLASIYGMLGVTVGSQVLSLSTTYGCHYRCGTSLTTAALVTAPL